jgi:hypothetical protein
MLETISLGAMNMDPNKEQEVRKTLDKLFDDCNTQEQKNELKFLIDDYLDEGYKVKSYILKYNLLMQKINNQEGN